MRRDGMLRFPTRDQYHCPSPAPPTLPHHGKEDLHDEDDDEEDEKGPDAVRAGAEDRGEGGAEVGQVEEAADAAEEADKDVATLDWRRRTCKKKSQ